MDKKRIAFITLGCKVNMYDTQAMRELFLKRGYREVPFEAEAEVYLINTCSVTNVGDKKSRKLIRQAKRLNPNAVIIACGCYAQTAPQKVAEIEGVSIIAGIKDRGRIADIAEEYIRSGSKAPLNAVAELKEEREFEPLTVEDMEGHTRAYLKIQEGCNRFCTYCIIPYARGPIRSRKPQEVIAEAERLAAKGYKELVLTGIHIASYGLDLKEGIYLADIIEGAHKINGIERIRFSSMEPLAVTQSFVNRMKALPKVCPHFHLSLQSGCGKTLKEMGRRYTPEEYYAAVCRIREAYPLGAVATDIIVGFPGESEEDFKESLAFAEKCALAKIHVFPYSPKSGTPAAERRDQIPADIKARRAKEMGALSEKLQRSFMENMLDTELKVLFEREAEAGVYEGYTENYVRVLALSDTNLHNRILGVKITDLCRDSQGLCVKGKIL